MRVTVKPEQWTHHHVHRLFHISMSLCFGFVAVVLFVGMVVGYRVGADTTPKSGNVTLTAQVGGISAEPITTGNTPTAVPSPAPTGEGPVVMPTPPPSQPVPSPSSPADIPTLPTGSSGQSGTGGEPGAGEPQAQAGVKVEFTIEEQYKLVLGGNKVISRVQLFGGQSSINGLEVHYTVIAPSGDVVLEVADYVSFVGQTEYFKTFTIAPQTPIGVYTIIVRTSLGGITSMDSDTFRLLAAPQALITELPEQASSLFVVWSLLLILFLLFCLLAIYAYVKVVHHTMSIREWREQKFG